MLIKGILFDKDGTLLEFDKTWRPIALEVIKRIKARYGLDGFYQEKLGEAIGLFDSYIDSIGSLSSGTNKDVAMDFLSVCSFIEDKEEFISWSTATFNEVAATFPFYTVEGAKNIMSRLKERGIVIGLATADTLTNAEVFLRKSGLLPYFDFIGADDGIVKPKPDSAYMVSFCNRFSLPSKEVAVVGDTLVDMDFAINSQAGLKVGVLSGTGSEEILKPKANLILGSINNIFVDDSFVWEDL